MKIRFSGYIPRMFENGTSMFSDDFEISLNYNVKDLIIEDIYDKRENGALTFYIDNEYYGDNEELFNYFEEHYVENEELFSCIDEITFNYIDDDGLGYDIVLSIKDEKFEELLRG